MLLLWITLVFCNEKIHELSLNVSCFCKPDCKISPYSYFKKSLSVFITERFCFPKQNSNDEQDRNSLFYFSSSKKVICYHLQHGFSMLHALFNYANKIWKTYVDKKVLLQNRDKTHTQIKGGNSCLLKRKRFWMAAQSQTWDRWTHAQLFMFKGRI